MWLCARPLSLAREMRRDGGAPWSTGPAVFKALQSCCASADAVSLCVLNEVCSASPPLLHASVEHKTPWRASVHLHLARRTSPITSTQRALLHHVLTWALGPDSERRPCLVESGPPLRLTAPLDLAYVPVMARRVLAREATPHSLQAPWYTLSGRSSGASAHAQLGRVRVGSLPDRRGSLLIAPRSTGKTFVALSVMASNVMRTVVVVRNADVAAYWRALIARWLPRRAQVVCRVMLPHERARTMPDRVIVDECMSRTLSCFKCVAHVLVLGTTITHVPINLIDAPNTSCFAPMTISSPGIPLEGGVYKPAVIEADLPDSFSRLVRLAARPDRDLVCRSACPSLAHLLMGPARGDAVLCRTGSCGWPCGVCMDDLSAPMLHCVQCCSAICLSCRNELQESSCPFCRASPFEVRTCARAASGDHNEVHRKLSLDLACMQRYLIDVRVVTALDLMSSAGSVVVVSGDPCVQRAMPKLPRLRVQDASALQRGVYPTEGAGAAVFFADAPSTEDEQCRCAEYAQNRASYVLNVSW